MTSIRKRLWIPPVATWEVGRHPTGAIQLTFEYWPTEASFQRRRKKQIRLLLPPGKAVKLAEALGYAETGEGRDPVPPGLTH